MVFRSFLARRAVYTVAVVEVLGYRVIALASDSGIVAYEVADLDDVYLMLVVHHTVAVVVPGQDDVLAVDSYIAVVGDVAFDLDVVGFVALDLHTGTVEHQTEHILLVQDAGRTKKFK